MTAQVVIDDIIPRTQLIATASQTVFNTNWTADVSTDINVYARADGVEPNDATQLVSSSAYNVTFIGVTRTVRVTFLSGRTVDDVITIVRNTPAERTNLYINSNFLPSMLNQDFGILTLVDQQAQMYDTVVNPGYNISATIADSDKVLPILAANQIWAKNNDDDEIIVYDVPASGGLAPKLAKYLVQTATSELPNAQSMGVLASGLVVNTTTTGVQLTRILTGVTNQTAITNGSGILGNPTVGIATNPTIPGTGYIIPPSGTTAQRPVSPTNGMMRYNTDESALEVYEGTLWDPLSGGVVDLVSGTLGQIGVDNTDQANPIVYIVNNPVIPGNGGITLPSGTTAQRAGILGTIRFNSQTLEFEGTTDGAAWNTFQTSSGTVLSVSGTANQINSTGGANPILSLSATINAPGTFNIQSTTAVSAIINDSTMATASATNLSTSSAIKAYVDSLVTGLNIQGSCVCATTVALTVTYANGASGIGATLTNAGVQAALLLDGVSPSVGQRVLVKNQASSLQNGIYTVTNVGSGANNWIMTRATDYDTSAEIQPGDLVILTGGTTQTQSSWIQTDTVVTIGTDPIAFIQFTASLPVNVASGGTGKTSFTAYAPIVGGTTTTGALQSITLGASGTLYQSNGVGVLPGFTTATYPSTSGTTGTLLRSNGTNIVNSTSTFADTYTASNLLYSNGANTVIGLATANNGVLVTSAGGVPSISSTLPAGLTIPTPIIAQINDSNANETLTLTGIALSVNYVNITNSIATANPSINFLGDDTNVGGIFSTKGTGQFNFNSANTTTPILINSGTGLQHSTALIFANTAASRNVTFPDASGTLLMTGQAINTVPSITFSSTTGVVGTTTNDSAASGSVGYLVEQSIPSGSPVSLTSTVVANIASITIGPGDFDVWGVVLYTPAATTTSTRWAQSISTTSATFPTTPNGGVYSIYNGTAGANQSSAMPVGMMRVSVAAPTTYYLIATATFAISTMTATGYIGARVRR